jgi:endonuclease III
VQAADVAEKAEKKVRKARATGKKVAKADVETAVQAAAVAEVKAEEAIAAAELVIEEVQAQPASPEVDNSMAELAVLAEHLKKMMGL